MQIPKRQSEILRNANKKTDQYLTSSAIARLKEELYDLEKNKRPKTIKEMQFAAEDGDFSENAPYQDAKHRLRRINTRILSLNERIKHAILIEPGADPSGRIRIGSTVVLKINSKQITYQILGSQETNPSRGRISYLSPLGSALLNHTAGEDVSIKTDNKDEVYHIVEVK